MKKNKKTRQEPTVKPAVITIEVTPDHWDHIDEDDVARWVLQALLKLKMRDLEDSVCEYGGATVQTVVVTSHKVGGKNFEAFVRNEVKTERKEMLEALEDVVNRFGP